MMSRAGIYVLKYYELGTGSAHAVFTQKSLAKYFGMLCTELEQKRWEGLPAACDQHHVVLHVVGSSQIPGCIGTKNPTRHIRYMKYPCLRYKPQQFVFQVMK